MEIIFKLVDQQLLENLLYVLTFDLVIALTAVFFIEAIKVSFEKLTGNKTGTFLKFILSIIVIAGISVITIIVFHSEERVKLNTFLLIVIVWIKSWAAAALCYNLLFKIVFSAINILYNKIKTYLTDTEIDLSHLTGKLMKNKILLEKEIFLRRMQKLEIAESLKAAEGEVK